MGFGEAELIAHLADFRFGYLASTFSVRPPQNPKDLGFRVFSPFALRWCRPFGLKTPALCRTGNHDLLTFWPRKSRLTDFCSHILSYSRFRVRHDAGVFRPNGRQEQKRNGEKTLKPRSFGVWGGRTKKVVATSLNQRPAKCAIARPLGLAATSPPADEVRRLRRRRDNLDRGRDGARGRGGPKTGARR